MRFTIQIYIGLNNYIQKLIKQLVWKGSKSSGLISTLAVDDFPEIFDGGLAIRSLVGDFSKQINHVGDFRVVFDYFFPHIIPGSPVQIPQEVINNWDVIYKTRIEEAISSNPHATQQLLKVTRANIDPGNKSSIEQTILGLLWFNVFSTNDTIEELGGQPFDNINRIYFGSDDDLKLNRKVKRFEADQTAIIEIIEP